MVTPSGPFVRVGRKKRQPAWRRWPHAGWTSDVDYPAETLAPAPSRRASLALSAASLLTFSSTGLGAPSTRSLASFGRGWSAHGPP